MITGRLKEIIVRNGENISAAEVEAVMATHPAVTDVAVVALPDTRRGERCCAVVVPIAGALEPTLDDLARHCRDAGLARFKTPEQLAVVETIPRNGMGKILRQRLRDELISQDQGSV